MNQEEQGEKQVYIRKTITEAGYNLEHFINYLRTVKENGDSIENWTVEELRSEVENYKRRVSADAKSIVEEVKKKEAVI